MKARELLVILKANECVLIRYCKGSHQLWSNSDGTKTATIPLGDRNHMNKRTIQTVLKQLGVKV